MILISVTLFNTFLGEKLSSVQLLSVLVAFTVMYKGLIVIDHFMELKYAHKYLRLLMRLYVFIFPSLIIVIAFL
ncbi:hypothetical protein [Photobacterium pectinilyticum]|uniref:hypothetical protein n=1 Tax=Photobacterium pectinilyticum TaxID=2906793 RepID=UPI0020CD635D|nr:hypothetical protein [Photobacterium sp. ZSDE20]